MNQKTIRNKKNVFVKIFDQIKQKLKNRLKTVEASLFCQFF